MVSYNVLADKYATGERSGFAYCPPASLAWPSRLRRILGEVLEAAPDALCMQEVEVPAFRDHFLPILSARGYAGAYVKNDGTEAAEPVGVAVFWRADKFTLVERRQWSIAELAQDRRFTARFISAPVPGEWSEAQTKGHWSLLSWLKWMKVRVTGVVTREGC